MIKIEYKLILLFSWNVIWNVHSWNLVVFYTHHTFKFMNTHFLTNGRFREPASLSYYMSDMHKQFHSNDSILNCKLDFSTVMNSAQ